MFEYFKQVFSPSPEVNRQSRISQRNYKSVQSRGFVQQKNHKEIFDYSQKKPVLGKHHQVASSQIKKRVFEMNSNKKAESEDDQERVNTIPLMGNIDSEYYEQTNFFEKNPKDIFNETLLFETRINNHKPSHNSSLNQTAKMSLGLQLGATQKINKAHTKILEQPMSDLNDTQPMHESEEDSHIEEEGVADLQDDFNRNQIVLRSPMNKIHATMNPIKSFKTQFRDAVPEDYKNTILFSNEGSLDSLRLGEHEELRQQPQQTKFARGSVAAVSSSSDSRSGIVNPRELNKFSTFNRKSQDVGLGDTQKIQTLSKNHNPAQLRVKKKANPLSFNDGEPIQDLSRSNLDFIYKEIFNMTHLQELRIDENKIKEVPLEIENLKQLRILTLSKNMLTELPQSLQSLQGLEKLDFSSNSIHTLPDIFTNLILLKCLLLDTNQLNQVPQSLGYLKNLEEFSLDWFCYLNPPKPKAVLEQKEPHLFATFLAFCLQRTDKRVSRVDESPMIQQRSYRKNQRNFKSQKVSLQISTEEDLITQRENSKTFLQFLMAFYQLEQKQEINEIKFQTKSKTLIHEVIKNQHTFLLRQLCQDENIDVNIGDEEGLTPLQFTLQQNLPSMARIILASGRCDTEKKAQGVNYPLHSAVFKHKFLLANEMVAKYGADINVNNTYGSNVLHILFANYQKDKKNARLLTQNLIEKKIELNLVDNNGFSPIHVAIKKEQVEALKFALQYNSKSNPKDALWFNFDIKGKQGVTPLHMSIMKNNIEAFRSMIEANACNFFVRDEMLDLPRHKAIINSVFYRILYRKEKNYYKKEASKRDISPIMLQSVKNYQEFKKEIQHQQEMQFKSFDFSYLYDKPETTQNVTKVNQMVKESFFKTGTGCETPGKSQFFQESKNMLKHVHTCHRAFEGKQKGKRSHYNSASVAQSSRQNFTAAARTKRVLQLPNKDSHKILQFSSDSESETPKRPLSPNTKPSANEQQIFKTQKFPKGALKAFAIKKQNQDQQPKVTNLQSSHQHLMNIKKSNFNQTFGQQNQKIAILEHQGENKKLQKRRNTAGTTGSVALQKGTLNASKNLKSHGSVQRKPKNQKIINSINQKIFGDRSPTPELMDCSRQHDDPPMPLPFQEKVKQNQQQQQQQQQQTVVINNIFINSLSIAIQSKQNALSEDSADNQSSVTEGLDVIHPLAETKKQIAVEISSPPTPKSFIDPLSAESQRNPAMQHLMTATAEFSKDEFGNDVYKVGNPSHFTSQQKSQYLNGMSGFSGTERSLGRGERSEAQSRNPGAEEVQQKEMAFVGSFHANTNSFANPRIIASPPLKEEVTPLKQSGSQRKIQTIVTQNNLNKQAYQQVKSRQQLQTELASIEQESQDADLSVINDEVPVKKEINSEMKSNYLKSLINQYEPDIVEQLKMNLQSPELSPRQFSQTQNLNANNVFINSCQVITAKNQSSSLHSRMQSQKNCKVEGQQFNFVQKNGNIDTQTVKGRERLEISQNKYGDIFFFVVEKKNKHSQVYTKIYKELVPRLPHSSEARFILTKIVQKLPNNSLLKPDLLYIQSMYCSEPQSNVQQTVQPQTKVHKKPSFSTLPSSCQVLVSQEGVNSILNSQQNKVQRSQVITQKLPKKSEKLQQYLQQSQQMSKLADQIGVVKMKPPVNGSQGLLSKQKGGHKIIGAQNMTQSTQKPVKKQIVTSEGETIQILKKQKQTKQRYAS